MHFLKSKLKVFFWLIFFNHVASAAIQISDPQNFLMKISEQLKHPAYSELYKLGQKAIYTNYIESCEISCADSPATPTFPASGSCSSTCKEIQQERTDEVLTVDDTHVSVLSSLGDYYERQAEEVNSCQGNLAQIYLQNLDTLFNLSGTLSLEKMTQFNLEIIDHGQPQTLTAYSLWGSFQVEGTVYAKLPVKISVAPQVPGVAQIVMFSVMNKVWYKLKGIE